MSLMACQHPHPCGCRPSGDGWVHPEEMAVGLSQLRNLIAAINLLPYCPFCGQGHAMHTDLCRLKPLLTTKDAP